MLFFLVEIYVAVEPVLPPYLLRQKVPVLVGCSNALVAVCNLSVTYYFPTWFQTVMLTSASTAGKIHIWYWDFYGVLTFCSITGLHLLPNSICISTGSFFAGWVMIFPFFHLDLIEYFAWRWVMHRTGEYKMINMIFGILPFFAAILMTQMKEDSYPAHLWLSIVKHFPCFLTSVLTSARSLTQMPLGFGNAVVLQTMFSQFL